MSHVIPLRLFQILKSSRWNCNVCGLCPKLTALNYVRLLGGCPHNSSRSSSRSSSWSSSRSSSWSSSRSLSRSRGSSTMSHVIPLRLFQTLKSSRWNCNVCGLCRKMTVLNYVRLLGGCSRKGSAHRQRGRAYDAPARFLQSWFCGSSAMSHVIPLRLFQILKSSRWNCNVCGLCRKMTVLNYVRLLGGCPRKGEAYRQRGRAHDTAGRARQCRNRIRSPSPRPRCPRPRPSRRTNRTPRRSRGSRPRSGSGPPGSPGSRRSRHAGTRPRTPDS